MLLFGVHEYVFSTDVQVSLFQTLSSKFLGPGVPPRFSTLEKCISRFFFLDVILGCIYVLVNLTRRGFQSDMTFSRTMATKLVMQLPARIFVSSKRKRNKIVLPQHKNLSISNSFIHQLFTSILYSLWDPVSHLLQVLGLGAHNLGR